MKKAVNRGFWREQDGLVARKWQRITRVTVRQDDFASDPIATGRFQLQVTPEDADTVYVSEGGPPDPTRAAKLDGRVYETAAPAVWLLAVDSTGKAATGPVCEWRAPLRVKPDVKRVSNGHRVALLALPRAASIRATFDGSDPRTGPVVLHAEINAPADAVKLRVVAELDGRFSEEQSASLVTGMSDGGGRAPTPPSPLRPDSLVTMTSRFEPRDTAAASAALDRLAKLPGAGVRGGSVDLNGGRSETDFLTLRFGGAIRIPADTLAAQVEALRGVLAATAPTLKLRLDSIAFPSGRDFEAFCDATGQDFDQVTWEQEP